jgi:hypothetical protein
MVVTAMLTVIISGSPIILSLLHETLTGQRR